MKRKRSRIARMFLRPYEDPIAETIRKNVLGRAGSALTSIALCSNILALTLLAFHALAEHFLGAGFISELSRAVQVSSGELLKVIVATIFFVAIISGIAWPIIILRICNDALRQKLPLAELAVIPKINETLAEGFKSIFKRLAVPGVLFVLLPGCFLAISVFPGRRWGAEETILLGIGTLGIVSHGLMSLWLPYAVYARNSNFKTLISSLKGWWHLAKGLLSYTPLRFGVVLLLCGTYFTFMGYTNHSYRYYGIYHRGTSAIWDEPEFWLMLWYSIELLALSHFYKLLMYYRKNLALEIRQFIDKTMNEV